MAKQVMALLLALTLVFSMAGVAVAEERTDESRQIETSDGTYTFYETGLPVTEEKSTFTVLLSTTVTDMESSPLQVAISEATNVYPEWIVVPRSAAAERLSLMWASGDYPDVIGPNMVKMDDINTYGPLGVLAPLNELFEKYATWLNEYANEDSWREMTCFDGNMYYIPSIGEPERYTKSFAINTEWLDALELDMPTNVDEFYDVLVAFRDQDPNGNGEADEVAFAIGSVWETPFDTLPAFFGAFGRVGTYYVDDDGQVIDGRLYEEHKEGLKFLQKCYNEGLLDLEVFTLGGEEFRAKGASTPSVYGTMFGYMLARYYVGTHNEEQYEMMPLLADKNGERQYIFDNSNDTYTIAQMLVTTNCECPEVVMRWADYMMDPAISLQINYAPIGVGFEYDDNGDLIQLTDEDGAPEGFDSFMSWRQTYNEQQFPRSLQELPAVVDYLKENLGYERIPVYSLRIANEAVEEYYLPYKVQEIPVVTPTFEETDQLNMYTTDLKKLYEETIASWITGTTDIDAEWDSFVANMYSFGAQEVIDIKQAQVDRYYGKD